MTSLNYAVSSIDEQFSSDKPNVTGSFTLAVGTVCLVWYLFIAGVGSIGYIQLYFKRISSMALADR